MKKIDISNLNVALVSDLMTGFGGADRLLFSLLNIFPKATIYTSIFDSHVYPEIENEVKTTFLQKFKSFKRHINFLTPIAFENLSFEGFDLVISLSANAAKGIITDVYQKHICILLTPPRHQWDREINVRALKLRKVYSFLSKILSHYLRIWDIAAIKRVDEIISISKYIKQKVKKIYRRDSFVIYPGVSKFWFEPVLPEMKEEIRKKYELPKHFLLSSGRLFDHKRVDWIIEACKRQKENLIIVGEGPDKPFLRKVAGKRKNIHFLGYIPDEDLRVMYSIADCLIFPPIEDFGYVPVEAMACGTPVLVFAKGGASETVKTGVTGEVFDSLEELNILISKKVWKGYNTQRIIRRAKQFSEEKALLNLKKHISQIYEKK